MEKLYSANVEKFKDFEKNDLRVRFEVDVDSIHPVLGIVEDGYIYDLLTDVSYPILKKFNNGLIDPSCDVIIGKEYATNIKPFYEKNIKEVFFLQLAAKKTRTNIKKKSNQKVKVR